jgi:hypothetical protein
MKILRQNHTLSIVPVGIKPNTYHFNFTSFYNPLIVKPRGGRFGKGAFIWVLIINSLVLARSLPDSTIRPGVGTVNRASVVDHGRAGAWGWP